ncbi:MAG: transporter [Firmicutes bacterium]|nr:transporter [Bacillota bacterium]
MNWKIVLAIVSCNVVFTSASYTMLIPFLPLYLINELGVSFSEVSMWSGAIFSISFIVGAFMAPIWGRLADKKGKKLMAVRAGIGLSIVYFLGGCVTSPEQLFLVRLLQGFANGLWPANLSIISSSVPKEKLGVSLGIMQSAQTTGMVLGPLLGGWLAEFFGMRFSFILAGGVLAVVTVIMLVFVPAPKRILDLEKSHGMMADIQQMLKNSTVLAMLICALLIQMVMMILQPILTIYISELQGSMENIMLLSGIVFSLSGIAGAIAAPFWGKYCQRWGFSRALWAALGGAGILLVLQYFPHDLILFSILQFILGMFIAGVNPSVSVALVSASDVAFRSRIFGMMTSAQQLGAAIGPLIGGVMSSCFNIKYVFIFSGIVLILNSFWIRKNFFKNK